MQTEINPSINYVETNQNSMDRLLDYHNNKSLSDIVQLYLWEMSDEYCYLFPGTVIEEVEDKYLFCQNRAHTRVKYPALKNISHIHSSSPTVPIMAPYPKPISPMALNIINNDIRIQWV